MMFLQLAQKQTKLDMHQDKSKKNRGKENHLCAVQQSAQHLQRIRLAAFP